MKKRLQNIIAFAVAIIMTLAIIPSANVGIVAQAASYSSDYRYWSQGASDVAKLRQYGCWVVAQAKMIYEANINREASFNPDTYYYWQRDNGYINSGFYQLNGAQSPVAYANQRGKNLEYLGYWNADNNQLWFNINAGYYTILKVKNGGHYVMLDNASSKQHGQLYCYDSWSQRTSYGSQPLSVYGTVNGGYVYKANNPSQPTQPTKPTRKPVNLGDNFYAYIIKNNTWKHLGLSGDNVCIAPEGNDSSSPKQIWHFIRQSDNSYKIVNEYNGKCLDAYNSNTTNETNVIVYGSHDSSNQRWFIYNSGNAYSIKAAYCDLYLDSYGGGSNPGNNIQLFQQNNSEAQVFSIYGLTQDGVNYKKPTKPSKVGVYTTVSGDEVEIKWSNAPRRSGMFDSRQYTVAVYNNSKVLPVKIKSGLTKTSATFNLNQKGSYYVTVTAVNAKYDGYSTKSDKVYFCMHDYVSVGKTTLSCEAGGYETMQCSYCHDSYQNSTPALGHTYATAAVKATLTKDGSTVTQCTTCGEIKTKSSIPRVSLVYLTNTVFTYNGNILRPSVVVKDRTGKTLKNGTDYTVKYSSGCKNVGQYSVTVTLKGKYAGTKTLTYKIVPKGTSISKLTAGKKQFTAKWTAQTAQTTGYELQYSTSSSMSGAKTVTVGKNKTTSSTVKKLKGKKKYYVRIRTYKTVKIGGKTVKLYSAWSKVKSVKTK